MNFFMWSLFDSKLSSRENTPTEIVVQKASFYLWKENRIQGKRSKFKSRSSGLWRHVTSIFRLLSTSM